MALGINCNFIATVGSALNTVERGGKPRHSIRAAIRMPKRRKEDEDFQTLWVTLNIRDFNAEYAKGIQVGQRVVVNGTQRTSQGDDGRTFVDIDVSDITAFPKTERAAREEPTPAAEW